MSDTKTASAPLALLLALVLLLVPYGTAVALGQPQAEATGLARWSSAAASVYCADGWTPVLAVLLAESALLLGAVAAARAGVGRGRRWAETLRAHGGALLALLVLVAVPFLIGWRTDSSACDRGRAFFWESIFIEVFILAILAISYNLMFGFAGIVSFGHAAFFGMGAYTVGLLMLHLNWPWWLAILGALLVGVLIALIKGGVGLRIKGLYFALFTLAFAEILFLLAGNRIFVGLTGAEDGFTFDVPDFLNMTRNRLGFYYLALAAMLACYALVRRLMSSPTGHVLSALRDNEARAQMLGYNTFHFKLIAIVLAGVMASGAGVLRGLALKGASPNVLSLDFTMTPLLMTLIGGQGTFLGPVVGAFGVRLTEQALRDATLTVGSLAIPIGERWSLLLGLLFVLSVIVFPQGIVGTLRARWPRRPAPSLDLRDAPATPTPERAGE